MLRNGVCKYNSMINCETPDKCEKCNWNPIYFEEKKIKNREERKRIYEERKKNEKNKATLL